MHYGERVWLLGTIVMRANGEYQEHQIESDDPDMADAVAELRHEPWMKARQRFISDSALNWDDVLRHFNAWYDRIVAACDKPTYAERCEAFDATTVELRHLSDQVMKRASAADQTGLKISAMSVSEQLAILELGECLNGLPPAAWLKPSRKPHSSLAHLALSLAEFRNDHRTYPKALTELSPKYVAEVPRDPFSDANLIYKPVADGYSLYSVGPNGKDDGGLRLHAEHCDDVSEDESATEEEKSSDDIAIRMPPKKAKK